MAHHMTIQWEKKGGKREAPHSLNSIRLISLQCMYSCLWSFIRHSNELKTDPPCSQWSRCVCGIISTVRHFFLRETSDSCCITRRVSPSPPGGPRGITFMWTEAEQR